MNRPALVAMCFFACSPLYAQFETASVLGYVRDSSGAAVRGAEVTLINQNTGQVVKLRSSPEGAFEFSDVKIGTYHVAANAAGFNTANTAPFTVQVNARQRVDLTLQAGAAETVTVTDTAALLDTDDSERGQVIGTREAENLPLNGRAYADLAALVPGVRRDVLENGSDTSRDASFNINGQRSEFNNFLLDGLDNNAYGTSNQGFSNQAIPPSPDAISEFRVETDNYSAEYGRSPGAVINVSIRSGTNHFHGRAYDYLRNTVFNAIGPFTAPSNPLTGAPQKPTLIRNQFGGTLGGPILKDHLFFFADYEGYRQVTHGINSATVPTTDQNGTSALATSAGGYTFLASSASNHFSLRNPLTGQVYGSNAATGGSSSVTIPFSDPGVSSFAKGVLAALPTPNVSAFANNYASLPPDVIQDDKGDARFDATLGSRWTAFARYSQHNGAIASPPVIQGPAGGNSNGNVYIQNRQIAGGLTHIFTQNAILDARFGYTHTNGGKSPYGASLPSLMAGIPGLPTDPTVVRSLNGQAVANFSQFGNQTSNPQFQNPTVYNPKINYTWLHGRNSYKLGYEYQAIFTTIDDFNPVYGQDTYNGGYSYNGINGVATNTVSSTSDVGIKEAVSLADFLFGARDTYQLNNFQIVHLNQRMHFMYLQDDLRASSKLTLNLGLRYELVTPQWESSNLLANYNPATQSLVTATPGSLYNRALVNMPLLNLAPRIGLAYSATPRTVVRAAYGLAFAEFNREGGENLLVYNLPNIVNTTITQIPSGATASVIGKNTALTPCTSAQASTAYNPANPNPCFRTTSQGYPTNFTSPSVVTAASNLNTQARYIPPNLPTGYVQSWHATVQQQIGANSTFEVSYVGEHGVRLQVLADLNQAAPNAVTATCNATVTTGCLNLQARRPIPTFTTIEETLPAGFLAYNALQTKFEHRTGGGLYLLNSFTWSRAEDNASGHLDANEGDTSRVNLANLAGERGPSSYNQPLNETLTAVYDLPYGRGRRFGNHAPWLLEETLGGWQVDLINDVNSGLPVNLIYSPNSSEQLSPLLNQRPNQFGTVVIPKAQRVKNASNTALVAFNAAAVSITANPTPYGNAGRNSIRFDPFYETDFGVHKNFALPREGTTFDFRAEAFNVFNLTNYAYPASTVGSGTFGAVTSATTFTPRVLQFAGKIIF